MKFRQVAIVVILLWIDISVAGRQASYHSPKNRIRRLEIGVVDCNYKGAITLHFDDLKAIESLQAALKQYGFDVKEGERETEMFVLTELKK
jgi:hypothetical protein